MTLLVTTNPTYAVVTQIVAKGNLALEGTAYKLTLAEGDDAITDNAVVGPASGR